MSPPPPPPPPPASVLLLLVAPLYIWFILAEAVDCNDACALAQILGCHEASSAQLTAALQRTLLQREDRYYACAQLLLQAGADAAAKDGSGEQRVKVI